MKTVGVISDTHVPVRARKIPQKVFRIFEKVNLIIHAGDLVDLSVIDELEQYAPVLAVYGNMDRTGVRGKLRRLDSVKVSVWKIGVMHNPGAMHGMRGIREVARQNGFNVLVYGHTHKSRVKWEGKTLFINPGSPTNPIPPFIVKPSVALLKLSESKIFPEIVHV